MVDDVVLLVFYGLDALAEGVEGRVGEVGEYGEVVEDGEEMVEGALVVLLEEEVVVGFGEHEDGGGWFGRAFVGGGGLLRVRKGLSSDRFLLPDRVRVRIPVCLPSIPLHHIVPFHPFQVYLLHAPQLYHLHKISHPILSKLILDFLEERFV